MSSPHADPTLTLEPSIPEAVLRHQAAVQEALRAGLTWGPLELQTLLHSHLGWVDQGGVPVSGGGGKALRPALCLFACEAVGGIAAQALPAAVALEVIHNFSLIHDDIQDEDQERRHRPTVWAVWGKPRALVAGNVMRALADTAIDGLSQTGTEPERALEAAATLSERCLEMIEGQYLDLDFETRRNVTTGEYLAMVSKKTGALVEVAMHLGAFLGGGDAAQVDAFRRCGRLLGLAFQARDDVLGIWGDSALTGKAIGADIRRKKQSLPVVYGFTQAGPADRRRLEALYANDEMDDRAVSDVMTMLDGLGARDYAQAVAEEQGREAARLIAQAELDPGTAAAFDQLTDFMVHRNH